MKFPCDTGVCRPTDTVRTALADRPVLIIFRPYILTDVKICPIHAGAAVMVDIDTGIPARIGSRTVAFVPVPGPVIRTVMAVAVGNTEIPGGIFRIKCVHRPDFFPVCRGLGRRFIGGKRHRGTKVQQRAGRQDQPHHGRHHALSLIFE